MKPNPSLLAPAPSRSQNAKQRTIPGYLASLSESQLKAATHPPSTSLQILAGPGSGKTRVLTSRVTWLILDPSNKLRPEDVVVVTFTNKTANEMKVRLHALIGKERTSRLVIGTFHSMCAKYLRKYGKLIDLPNNFTIADADDSKKMLKAIIKELEPELRQDNLTIRPDDALSEISKAKAKDLNPDTYREFVLATAASESQKKNAIGAGTSLTPFRLAVARIFEKYQRALKEANAVDFDDLLVYGVHLFRENPQVARNIQHVLVDEFQDTNTAQYLLMSLIAISCQSVSVVGDPDQSIYGWRSAEIGNLTKMRKEFKGTAQVRLEENYRSTGSILEAALKVVQQDEARVHKGLYTSHPRGPPVVLKSSPTAPKEAAYIASEVKRLMAYAGGMLDHNDFAILLRFNAISRAIEAEFQKEGIPFRMMGGHKFFDRMEVKDLLAYLALADNPGFTPAFLRVVNVPKRGIGDKSVADLVKKAAEMKLKPMELAESIVEGKKSIPGIKPSTKKSLADFVGVVKEIRKMANEGKPVSEMVEVLLKRTNYEDYLKREPDFDSRWLNVKELISFSFLVSRSTEELEQQNLDGEKVDEDGDYVDPDVYETDFLLTSSAPTATNESNASSNPPSLKREHAEVIDLSISDEDDDKEGTKGKAKATPPKKKAKVSRKHFAEALLDKTADGPSEPRVKKEATSQVVVIPDDEDEDQGDAEEDEKTPLRIFLEASILATDVGEQEDENGKRQGKVTISTCHAAKGLEWPVVFVPAVEEGTYPSFRAVTKDTIDEERRLLYVAMTRAEAVLYLTHSNERMMGGETHDKALSKFIGLIAERKLGGAPRDEKTAVKFCSGRPDFSEEERATLAKVCRRPKPAPEVVQEAIAKYDKSAAGVASRRMDAADTIKSSMVSLRRFSNVGVGAGWSRASGTNLGKFSNDNLQSQGNAGMRENLGFSRPNIGLFSSALDESGYQLGYAGRVKKPLMPPSIQSQRQPPPPPSFTDEVRLQARPEDAVAVAAGRTDGMAPRPRADLQSFQTAHDTGISSILGLLGPSEPLPGDSSGDSSPMSGSLNGGGERGRKRLGMGMARPSSNKRT